MQSLPDIIDAMSNLDLMHLLITAIVIVLIARPDIAAKAKSVITRNKTIPANGAMSKAKEVESALEKHEAGCERRYDQINRNFEKLFDAVSFLKSEVAEIKGYLKGKQSVK